MITLSIAFGAGDHEVELEYALNSISMNYILDLIRAEINARASGDIAGYFAQVDRATLINPDDQPYHVADLGDSLSRSQVTNLLNLGMIEVVDRHEVSPVKEFCRKNYFTRNSVADQQFNS